MATPPEPPSIAVAIPCYNEAGAVDAVVAEWRDALPGAEIVVFDNNSGDGTGAIARRLGVRVVEVREQGKGHVVRAIFEDLADRDVVILVDGDGTYPASFAASLVEPVASGRADMTVGNRRPVAELGAMSPLRGLGNVLIGVTFTLLIGPGTRDLLSGYRAFGRRFREVIRPRSTGFEIEAELGAMSPLRGVGNLLIGVTFTLLIGPGTRDLLSGYRAFGRRFREVVRPRSTGFEIEAELVGQAVARGLKVVEVEVPYRPRIAGTASKLRAFRDGGRIVGTIVRQGARFRPWRGLGLLTVASLAVGLASGSGMWLLGSAGLMVAALASAAWIAWRG